MYPGGDKRREGFPQTNNLCSCTWLGDRLRGCRATACRNAASDIPGCRSSCLKYEMDPAEAEDMQDWLCQPASSATNDLPHDISPMLMLSFSHMVRSFNPCNLLLVVNSVSEQFSSCWYIYLTHQFIAMCSCQAASNPYPWHIETTEKLLGRSSNSFLNLEGAGSLPTDNGRTCSMLHLMVEVDDLERTQRGGGGRYMALFFWNITQRASDTLEI